MSAVRNIFLLTFVGGSALWYLNHRHAAQLKEVEGHRQMLAARVAERQTKLKDLNAEVTALEKKWDYSQSLKTAGEEVFSMQEEADKLRTEWRTKRNEFDARLRVARNTVNGSKVSSIRLKSGMELKNCSLGSLNDAQDTISISHDGGIMRVAAADLTGPVADYLKMGWKLELPPELDAPEVLTDLQVEVKEKDLNVEPTEAALPPASPMDNFTVIDLKARRAKAISRATVLNEQIAAAKKEAARKEEAISRIEGRYEAARMFGQDKQLSLKSQIAEANKKLFDFRMRIRRAEWEKLALKRDVTIIDNKLKELAAEASKASSGAAGNLR